MNLLLWIGGVVLLLSGLRLRALTKIKKHVYENAKDGSSAFYAKKKKESQRYRVLAFVSGFLGLFCMIAGIVITII